MSVARGIEVETPVGKWQKALVVFFSLGVLGGFGFGIHRSMHASLFLLRKVEVQTSQGFVPYDRSWLLDVAQVPSSNLFYLNLRAIEHRLLALDAISSVVLQKKLPDTLVISVSYREPVAIFQTHRGKLAYVDAEGRIFGKVDFLTAQNLPFLSGFVYSDAKTYHQQVDGSFSLATGIEKIREALFFLSAWESSGIAPVSLLSTLQWDQERGYRAWVIYTIRRRAIPGPYQHQPVRVVVEIGRTMDAALKLKLLQLSKVFQYLSKNGIATRHIWVDAGKKIVVKTVRDS